MIPLGVAAQPPCLEKRGGAGGGGGGRGEGVILFGPRHVTASLGGGA